MNSELRPNLGVVGDTRAGDHGLGRCAAIIDAGASELRSFNQGNPPAEIGQAIRKRGAALARADDDGVVVFHVNVRFEAAASKIIVVA